MYGCRYFTGELYLEGFVRYCSSSASPLSSFRICIRKRDQPQPSEDEASQVLKATSAVPFVPASAFILEMERQRLLTLFLCLASPAGLVFRLHRARLEEELTFASTTQLEASAPPPLRGSGPAESTPTRTHGSSTNFISPQPSHVRWRK